MSEDAAIELDLRGLRCPLPVLRTRKALRRLPAGTRLHVLCTDPLAALDIPNLVREEGDALEAFERTDAATRFTIRRGERPEADRSAPGRAATCLGDSAKAPHS